MSVLSAAKMAPVDTRLASRGKGCTGVKSGEIANGIGPAHAASSDMLAAADISFIVFILPCL
jgi:hypothetical protein